MKEVSVQSVLDLACAAQRVNGEYLRGPEGIYAADGTLMYYKQSNRNLISLTLGIESWSGPAHDQPALLKVKQEDRALADDIRQYFRKLAFTVLADGDDSFNGTVFTLLNKEMMPTNKLGFIACLPSTYAREVSSDRIKKAAKTTDEGYIGNVNDRLFDLDCEVIEVSKSKNYDAWNVLGLVDNKIASWMSKSKLALGPCVIVRANVKEHSRHWKEGFQVTRLNYVRAAQ